MNILLTGKPRCGKTTLVKKVIASLNLSFGGFYTEEIREKGERVGFSIVTLNGKSGCLARIDLPSKFRVGKYGVNMKDLEEIAAKSLREAIQSKEVIVVDEIGKMELFSEKFRHTITEALDNDKPVLATIMLKSSEFTDKIKKEKTFI